MTLKSRVQRLMTSMNVLPYFDVVAREGYFNVNDTFIKHRDLFEMTGKTFLLVHDGEMETKMKYHSTNKERYGCIGVVRENELRTFFTKLNETYQTRPYLKDKLMETKRSTFKNTRMSPLSLSDMNLALTGTLNRWSRDEWERRVARAGGRTTKRVSNNTDFLVVGHSSGKTKLTDAIHFGTPVITEGEFLKMVA